jgi:signal transduction histidine kinase
MEQTSIQELRNSFVFTQADEDERQLLQHDITRIADLAIEEFYKNHIKDNEKLSQYFATVDASRVLRMMKEFFVFIFTAPYDDDYVKRISEVGYVHYSINLKPVDVSYGFLCLRDAIRSIKSVYPVLKEKDALVDKVLAMCEHSMNESYFLSTQKVRAIKQSGYEIMGTLDELFTALNIHKENFNIIKKVVAEENFDIEKIQKIKEDPSVCTLGKLIHVFDNKNDLVQAFGIDVLALRDEHKKWHEHFVKIKCAMRNKDLKAVQRSFQELEKMSHLLNAILNASLKDFSTNGFLSLNSGIKAMHSIGEMFKQKAAFANDDERFEMVMHSIKDALQESMAWGIEELIIQEGIIDIQEYELYKRVKFHDYHFNIAIKLKPMLNQLYLKEILHLLLESIELELVGVEREQSLRHFADKAEHANRSKDEFLANMSHELRTPLNAVIGFSQILMMRKDTPENVKAYIEKINISGNNLLELVNTILDFAKLDSGKMHVDQRESNLADIFEEVETIITPMAEKKNISVTFPHLHSLILFIDPKLIKQVLLNLLSNAIKFTPEEGEVIVKLGFVSSRHSYRIDVCDNGLGISKENQAKLFQPFAQVDNVYQKEEKGTGLGLMLCKKIVEELHEGKMWVESEEGKGSCFYFSLPASISEPSTFTVEEAGEDACSILLVEDNEEYQAFLIEQLKERFNLVVTNSIDQAKHIIHASDFYYIVLDLFLTDGISTEVIQFMEEEGIKTPTSVITAEDDVRIISELTQTNMLKEVINKQDTEKVIKLLASIDEKSCKI